MDQTEGPQLLKFNFPLYIYKGEMNRTKFTLMDFIRLFFLATNLFFLDEKVTLSSTVIDLHQLIHLFTVNRLLCKTLVYSVE